MYHTVSSGSRISDSGGEVKLTKKKAREGRKKSGEAAAGSKTAPERQTSAKSKTASKSETGAESKIPPDSEARTKGKTTPESEARADKTYDETECLEGTWLRIKMDIPVLEQAIRHIEKCLDDLASNKKKRWSYGDDISTLSTAELVMGTCYEVQPWTSLSKKIRCPRIRSQITQTIGEYETQLKNIWRKLISSKQKEWFNGISRTIYARLVCLHDGRQWLLVGSTAVCLAEPKSLIAGATLILLQERYPSNKSNLELWKPMDAWFEGHRMERFSKEERRIFEHRRSTYKALMKPDKQRVPLKSWSKTWMEQNSDYHSHWSHSQWSDEAFAMSSSGMKAKAPCARCHTQRLSGETVINWVSYGLPKF